MTQFTNFISLPFSPFPSRVQGFLGEVFLLVLLSKLLLFCIYFLCISPPPPCLSHHNTSSSLSSSLPSSSSSASFSSQHAHDVPLLHHSVSEFCTHEAQKLASSEVFALDSRKFVGKQCNNVKNSLIMWTTKHVPSIIDMHVFCCCRHSTFQLPRVGVEYNDRIITLFIQHAIVRCEIWRTYLEY